MIYSTLAAKAQTEPMPQITSIHVFVSIHMPVYRYRFLYADIKTKRHAIIINHMCISEIHKLLMKDTCYENSIKYIRDIRHKELRDERILLEVQAWHVNTLRA